MPDRLLTDSTAIRGIQGLAVPNIYNWRPASQMVNFRGAKAQVRSGRAGARCGIACYGDSTTAGWDGTQVQRQISAYPARLAARLAGQGVPANIGNFAGNGNYDTGDTRIVNVGTGAWGGPNVFGGQTKTATGSANGVDFTPGVAFDRVDVDFLDTNTNAFTVSVDGGTAQTVTGTNTGKLKTVTLNLTGTNTSVINYRGGTASTQIQGFRAWSSTAPAIEVINGGRGTADTQGSASANTGTNVLACLVAMAPKLCIINFGINDANNGVTPATFRANITAMVTALQAINCDVISCVTTPVQASSTQTGINGYIPGLQAMADTLNVPLISWMDRYQSFAKATSQFGMSDNVHPNTVMYDDEAVFLANLLAAA